jgi:hypothetical protein
MHHLHQSRNATGALRGGYHARDEPRCRRGRRVSDPRPPDDGPGWPERDLEEKGSEQPAAGWSDDPYRYEPPRRYEPPAWEPPVFEPPSEGDAPAWERPVWEPPDSVEQPAVQPPAWEPPVWEPPAWEPPAAESPASEPAAREEEPAAQEEQPADFQTYAEPAASETPAVEELSPVEELPAVDELSVVEESSPGDEAVTADEPSPAEETLPAEEPPAEDEAFTAVEERPSEDEPPTVDEAPPADEQLSAIQAQPIEDEPLGAEEVVPAEEQSPAAEEAVAAEEPLPHAAEALADEDPAELPPLDLPAPVLPRPDEPANLPPQLEAQPPLLEAAEPTTAFEGSANAWDPKVHGNRRRSTTAEQAVPWLIGIILALAGMVIVLLALIFSSPGGLVAGQPTDTPSPSASEASAVAIASNEPSMEASSSDEPAPDPTATPEPNYGALEMVYLGRPSALEPIYLLRRDFSKGKDPEILAQADEGVEGFAWSPDGQVGAAIISNRVVGLRPGRAAKPLGDRISSLTFGWDSETVYAVRINRDGSRDHANILEIDFVSGATKRLAEIDYRHPVTAPEPPLSEAQFIDDGGKVRIYAAADGNLVVWILGAPDTYRVDPADGRVSKVTRQPTLWSPDGRQRVTLHERARDTVLRLRDRDGDVKASVTVDGLVSHVRWAGSSNEIVFTLGTLSPAGGVRQDLYVWDLRDGKDPMPLTSSGAAFGADWRGVMPNWAP